LKENRRKRTRKKKCQRATWWRFHASGLQQQLRRHFRGTWTRLALATLHFDWQCSEKWNEKSDF